MAFGPGTTGRDLSQKGSLTAHWPEAPLLESLKGLEAPAQEEAEKTDDPAAAFRLGDKGGDFLRHNFAMAVRNGTLDTTQVSIQLTAGADTARMQAEKEKEEKRKQDENLRFVRMLQDIQDRLRRIEEGLVTKYGKTFAEDMAKRYLEKEEAERLLRIEDEEERRHRIALAIKRRVDNGEINAPELSSPEYKEWLDTHEEKKRVLEAQAKEAIADVKAGKEFNGDFDVARRATSNAEEDGLAKKFSTSSLGLMRGENIKENQRMDDLFSANGTTHPEPGAKPFV